MSAITRLAAADHAAWNAYVAAHPEGSAWHRAEFGPAIAGLFGHRPHYLVARGADGTIRGVLPAIEMRSRLFGHFVVSMPYFNYGGVLADDAETATALCDAAAALSDECGAAHLELRHMAKRREGWPGRRHKVSMWLELPADADALWDAFPGKLRSQIRRPGKAGATAAVRGTEALDDFYAVFCRNMRDLGTPVYPRAFFAMVLEALPDSRIVTVELDGKAVAAGFLCRHGQRMEIPWASAIRDYNRQSVNMLLYWQALQHAIGAGCTRFDFGRCTPGEGTHRFKRQWGAEEVPLEWEYWLRGGGELPALNPANPKFALAISLWQRLPLWLANALGPWLVRNIP